MACVKTRNESVHAQLLVFIHFVLYSCFTLSLFLHLIPKSRQRHNDYPMWSPRFHDSTLLMNQNEVDVLKTWEDEIFLKYANFWFTFPVKDASGIASSTERRLVYCFPRKALDKAVVELERMAAEDK